MITLRPARMRIKATTFRLKLPQTQHKQFGSLSMQKLSRLISGLFLALTLATTSVIPPAFAATPVLSGVASWYGPGFHGRTTANGERYDMNAMTAAHKTLKFGTKVKVTNENNGKSVVVRINDRGPYIGARVIDLSKSAASAIDMIGPGTAEVSIEVLT